MQGTLSNTFCYLKLSLVHLGYIAGPVVDVGPPSVPGLPRGPPLPCAPQEGEGAVATARASRRPPARPAGLVVFALARVVCIGTAL